MVQYWVPHILYFTWLILSFQELRCLWNSNVGCTPPSILYKNPLHDPKNVCVICWLKNCVGPFELWCKHCPFSSRDLYHQSEAVNESAEALWRKNIDKKACYICGSKDSLRSFADIKHKHAGMVEDLQTELLKARQYIVHRNIRVKSGAVDIMVDGKQSMNSIQSSHCTWLSFTSDRMCDRCKDILREPATRIPFRRLCLQDNGFSKNKFQSNNVQEIQNPIQEKGIFCDKIIQAKISFSAV